VSDTESSCLTASAGVTSEEEENGRMETKSGKRKNVDSNLRGKNPKKERMESAQVDAVAGQPLDG
jgi:hypothetical protein